MPTNLNTPIYQHIKNHILTAIQAGQWKEGEAIPSELILAKQFGVSRMTVNRAMKELAAEQTLIRIQGSGTYVAQQKYKTTLVEFKSIAEEIRVRGHRHRSELHHLSKDLVTEPQMLQFEVAADTYLFHSIVLHYEDDMPIQVEERWVNPAVAPFYMQQDLTKTTANEYLMSVAPLQSGEYLIEAIPARIEVAAMLGIKNFDPCLVLRRRTRSMDQVATAVTMWHPGVRYQVTGRF